MLALPFIYGAQRPAGRAGHAGHRRRGSGRLQSPQAHLRARAAVHPPRGHLARAGAARSLQLSVGPHAARRGVHLAGVRGVPGAGAVVLVPLALAIAASRVVLGLHYPTDVLVGALVRRGRSARSARPSSDLMRVLFVSDVYFPARQRRLHFDPHLPRRSRARSASRPRWWRRRIPARPADTRPVDHPRALGRRAARSRGPALPRRPAAAARSNAELAARVDLVHIHTPFIAHYAGVRFAREHGLPVVATYHTFFEDYLHHYVPILPRGIGRFIARRFTLLPVRRRRGADLARARRCARRCWRTACTTPIEVLPTGLPAESFMRGDGARFRQQFELPADRPLLLYVGRVAYEKNIDFLLRMFVRVRARRPDALFVIAGEGPALRSPDAARARARRRGRTCGSSAISIAAPTCRIATRPAMPSCSRRAPKRRDWCCSRRWRRARRSCLRPSSARARSSRRVAARSWCPKKRSVFAIGGRVVR